MHILTFAALSDFPAQLEAHLRAFPTQVTAPDSGCESASECRHLVSDLLAFETAIFHPSLIRVLEEDHPTLTLTFERTSPYAEPTADGETDGLVSFQAARKRTLSILETLTEDQWARLAVSNGVDVTVIGLIHLLSANDWETLAALQRRLAACSAP